MSSTETMSTSREDRAIAVAGEWSRDWERVARFLSDHPEIASQAVEARLAGYLGFHVETDPIPFMSAAAQACVDAGGAVKELRLRDLGGVDLQFGRVHIHMFAPIREVFTREVGAVEQTVYTLRFDLPQAGDADA